MAEAGFRPGEVWPPISVALAWLGELGVVHVPGLPTRERVVFDDDAGISQIQLRAGLPELDAQWLTAHGIGHVVARRERWELEVDALERACDLFAACLMMPARAFAAALDVFPDDWSELSVLFGVTETAVALRAGEVTGRPIAVVGPHSLRGRGDATWTDEQLQRLRRRRGPRLVAARLRDDPRRLVVTAAV